jgi:hypothetical protein
LAQWRKQVDDKDILLATLQIQKELAAGYFEYSRPRKAEIYRKARELLAHVWAELDAAKDNNPSHAPHMQKLAEVIGSLSGVLKKIERGNAKET